MRLPAFLSVLFLLAVAGPRAQAQLTTLHSFANGDGTNPAVALVRGTDGNFYGTAPVGGGSGSGTVYRLALDGTLTVLHTFGDTDDNGFNADGATPAALVAGGDGNYYGTTQSGGTAGVGTVYRVAPDGGFTTLYNFRAADGNNPVAALVRGTDGNFYGTTLNGGASDLGTVYRITPDGAYTTLYSFTSGTGNAPSGALAAGDDGNYYGTTRYGGAAGAGTAFRVTPAGGLATIYSFGGAAGANPTGALVKGTDGNFYGAAPSAGANARGTVFRLTPGGDLAVLHAFSSADNATYPNALTVGADGNLYGTTNGGGTKNRGAVFRLTTGGTFTNLYTFTGGNDGGYPQAAPTVGADGNLYGTTSDAGANRAGTVFRLSVAGHPAFFTGEVALSNGVYYLAFPNNGNVFGYYSYLADPRYVYHFDLGYEYVFDAVDGKGGVFLYDFKSGDFFYTSPSFPFPYLYDFALQAALYYFPDPTNPQHYNTNGTRYFYNYATGKIITR